MVVVLCARNVSSAESRSVAGGTAALRETQVSSIVAGLSTRLVLHPVDSVKTRLQRIRGRRGALHGVVAIRYFLRKSGVGGLYKGIIGALIGVLPYSMLYMPSYELAQSTLSILPLHIPAGARDGTAGALAGLAGSLVKVPVDVVKKRLQAGVDPSLPASLKRFMAPGLIGLRRMYAGWGASLLYSVPYNAVQFILLERVKRVVRWVRKESTPKPIEHIIVGAITGSLTALVTEPMDVIKTRMMTQRIADGTLYRNALHCGATMIREEGWRAMWKGTAPRLVWVSTSSALWYGTYQTMKRALAHRRLSRTTAKIRGPAECKYN